MLFVLFNPIDFLDNLKGVEDTRPVRLNPIR